LARVISRSTFVFVLIATFCSMFQADAADSTSAEGRAKWQREDLQAFRKNFLNVDRSFSDEARSAAEARLAWMEHAAAPLEPAAFAVELCRIAALADNGHTQCLPSSVGKAVCARFASLVKDDSPWCHLVTADSEVPDFKNVSINFRVFGDQFYVIGIDAAQTDLLGARLMAVDGKPIEVIRETLRTFAGGIPQRRDDVAAGLLSSPQRLHAVGITTRDDSVAYSFTLPGGQRAERRLSISDEPQASRSWRQLPERAPWSLQEPDKPFRFRDAPEIDAVVVQLRQILDTPNEKLSEFLEKSERQRAALSRKNVVLDLRANGGGNFLQARDFMINWPTRAPGQFYVLTSRETFSAAITSLAYLKQAGTTRVSIIGEPAGDRLMFFSDGLPVQLPHSGLFFLPAVVRMDYADGCRKYDDCFEAIAQPGRPTAISLLKVPPGLQRIPISVPSIEPDVFVPETIDTWLSGEDSAMSALSVITATRAKAR
jgi:hypothetical protein